MITGAQVLDRVQFCLNRAKLRGIEPRNLIITDGQAIAISVMVSQSAKSRRRMLSQLRGNRAVLLGMFVKVGPVLAVEGVRR
ncbi:MULTISPECIES: hypothetical protein [Xanthomonas]|uniref:Uncharacterized protein n=1 Tax=Xanthomonas dyei TaxID=743699 RepID=A0ABZ0D4M8_9XANT|nr:hypothetical protein [Xanthomonas dyei]WOB24762.1 hypothetical protein NYR99_13230 [Xanthomonas dyei]WOB52390.1 hypothetical protein NYR95_13235 [Xanthomonas dyei]